MCRAGVAKEEIHRKLNCAKELCKALEHEEQFAEGIHNRTVQVKIIKSVSRVGNYPPHQSKEGALPYSKKLSYGYKWFTQTGMPPTARYNSSRYRYSHNSNAVLFWLRDLAGTAGDSNVS